MNETFNPQIIPFHGEWPLQIFFSDNTLLKFINSPVQFYAMNHRYSHSVLVRVLYCWIIWTIVWMVMMMMTTRTMITTMTQNQCLFLTAAHKSNEVVTYHISSGVITNNYVFNAFSPPLYFEAFLPDWLLTFFKNCMHCTKVQMAYALSSCLSDVYIYIYIYICYNPARTGPD